MAISQKTKPAIENNSGGFKGKELLSHTTQKSVEAFATYMKSCQPEDIQSAIRRQTNVFVARGFDSSKTKELFDLIVEKYSSNQASMQEVSLPAVIQKGAGNHKSFTIGAIAITAAIVSSAIFTIHTIRNDFNNQVERNRDIAAQVKTALVRYYDFKASMLKPKEEIPVLQAYPETIRGLRNQVLDAYENGRNKQVLLEITLPTSEKMGTMDAK